MSILRCGDTIRWIIKCFDELTTKELYEISHLRVEVFVVEQQILYQEFDRKDYDAYHIYAIEDERIVAYLRILPKGMRFDEMSIGRVLVKKEYRHNGISRQMMLKAMDYICNTLNEDAIRISGQAYLEKFYESLGFKRVSDIYIEEEIEHYEFLYTKN